MIDETLSLVDVTAYIPSNKAKAGTASIPKVNGSINARPTAPPNPGTAPIHIPRNTPSIR
jgi:hypothetical protein